MQHKKCMVFGGRRGLDQASLRQSIGRIPEVSKRIKEAQSYIDQESNGTQVADLFNVLNGWDGEYTARPKMRSLLAAVVQMGLYDRYHRHFGTPDYMVGNLNGVSAMNVAAKQMTFEKMVKSSDYFVSLTVDPTTANLKQNELKLTLTGVSLEEFGVFGQDSEKKFQQLPWDTKDCYQLLSQLNLDFQVEQFIHIGPTKEFRQDEMSKRKIYEFSLGDSLEMDPILNSFWKTA